MIYSNKNFVLNKNAAEETAKIIATVVALQNQGTIKLTDDTVYLKPSLWKDRLSALNWMSCLHVYFTLKKKMKPSQSLFFKDIDTEQLIGSIVNKKPKLYLF